MLIGINRTRGEERRTPALVAGFARDRWRSANAMSHRFDKLGQALPLELHGCGCGLCARQQRVLRQFWEAR